MAIIRLAISEFLNLSKMLSPHLYLKNYFQYTVCYISIFSFLALFLNQVKSSLSMAKRTLTTF